MLQFLASPQDNLEIALWERNKSSPASVDGVSSRMALRSALPSEAGVEGNRPGACLGGLRLRRANRRLVVDMVKELLVKLETQSSICPQTGFHVLLIAEGL